MSTKYPVDKPDFKVIAYDTQTKQEVVLIDQLQTNRGFTNYWLCEDLNENLLICNVENLEDMYTL